MNSFFDLIKEPTLKRLILVKHTNVLLAGVCQLCLLPIAKPGSKVATESAIDELKYKQLINEQKTFKNILKNLILINRDPLFIREIIFVLGRKVCIIKKMKFNILNINILTQLYIRHFLHYIFYINI